MTATAKSKVINAALSHIGEEGYDDIDVSPAPPKLAKVLAQIDLAQDWVLRGAPWLACMTYAQIDRANRDGNWKYPYVYDLPATYLRLWEMGTACKYQVGRETVDDAEKVVIWADSAGPLNVAYVERKAWEAYDAHLLNVISYELASRIAGPIQDDDAKAERMHQKAVMLIGMAFGAEAQEEGGQDPVIPSNFAALRAMGA